MTKRQIFGEIFLPNILRIHFFEYLAICQVGDMYLGAVLAGQAP